MRVLAYLRVSGAGQVDGDGERRQRETIDAFCKAHGLEVVEYFFEAGVSGTVEAMDRPEFVRMLARVDGTIDGIVVERLDRLARDLMISEFLLRECRTRGIKVFAADHGDCTDRASDGDDPTRVLLRQIIGAIAQWEKSMLVKKLRIARQHRKQKTGACEGQKRYGHYGNERQTLELIRQLRETHSHSFREIAVILNERGIQTRTGRPWTVHNLYNVSEVPKKSQLINIT